jgi:hypothetical protein
MAGNSMTKYPALLVSVCAWVGLLPTRAHAAGLPIVTSATVNYINGTVRKLPAPRTR